MKFNGISGIQLAEFQTLLLMHLDRNDATLQRIMQFGIIFFQPSFIVKGKMRVIIKAVKVRFCRNLIIFKSSYDFQGIQCI